MYSTSFLISFVEGRGAATYLWSGYVYAAVLFIVASVKTVILHNYHNVCFLTGMRVRTAVIGAVYRKVCVQSLFKNTLTLYISVFFVKYFFQACFVS